MTEDGSPAAGVIVGAAIGYGLAELQPFLDSVRASGCEAPVLLLLDRSLPPAELEELRSRGVVPHLVRNTSWLVRGNHPASRLARLALRSPLGRLVLSRAGAGRRLQLQSATNRRLHLYAMARAAHPRLFADAGWAFLTDVRDVHLQADPTAAFSAAMEAAPLHLFAEGPPTTHPGEFRLSDGGSTLRWVRGLAGDEVAAELADRPTLCSGTILVAPALLDELSSRMVALLAPLPPGTQTFGFDQGALNVLHHTGGLDDLPHVVHRNGRGGVLTLAAVARDRTWAFVDGQVTVADDEPAIVHQYDRVPELRLAWAPS